MVGKFGKLNVFGCFNWIGWETGKEKMILETSHGVMGMGWKVIVNMTSKIIYFVSKSYLNVNYPK